MVKKAVALLLALLLVVSAVGCSRTAPETGSSVPSSQSPLADVPSSSLPEENSSESDGDLGILNDMEVENNLFDVTITIPGDYLGEDVTQEKLDEKAKENGYKSATLNADGSATYVMTKKQHQEMMASIIESIQNVLDDMISSGDYPNISAIEPNNDFTNFKVTINEEDIGVATSMSVLAFSMCGGMYHTFNGTQPDDICVSFISSSTGQVIKEWKASDMG